MRVGFTGDVMLGRKVDEKQRGEPPASVWGDVHPRLQELDALFVNLECCVSSRGEKWTRTHRPFHFRASPDWAVPALEEAGVDWVTLANNHAMDYGEVALLDTLDYLRDAGIRVSGAGRDREEAFRPAYVDVEGTRFGFVSFTDNTPEFRAQEDSPGTAYIDVDVEDTDTREAILEAVREARPDSDVLVASLHWGPNMKEEPPPAHRRFARWLVDEGVDVVHGHSAHVFQGVEVYDGSPIIYDAGDFVDDYAVDPDLRNDRGFLFELEVNVGVPTELRLLPTEIDGCAVWRVEGGEADWSRQRMRVLSSEFGTEFRRDGDELVLEL